MKLNGVKPIMIIFIICILLKVLLGALMRENEMGGTSSAHNGHEKFVHICSKMSEDKKHLQNLITGGKLIFTQVLCNRVRVQTGLIMLRLQSSGDQL